MSRLQPTHGYEAFGRDRAGSDVCISDVSLVGQKDVTYLNEDGSFLAHVCSGALAPVQLKELEDAFATRAQSSRSLRDISLRDVSQDDVSSTGSLLAGYFDTRDLSTSRALAKINSKSIPISLGMTVCRSTRFTATSQVLWKRVIPVLKFISKAHEDIDPKGYGNQKNFLKKARREYKIADTAYTTVSVNFNLSTKIHIDKGDYEGGSGCIVVAGRDFEDGQLCFPRFRVAFDLKPGDLIVCSVHEWHGNLPLKLLREDGFRLSHILYARSHIPDCNRILDEKTSLGVPWSSTSHEDRLKEYVVRVKEYVDIHGKLPPVGATHRGMKVGEWVHNRRSDHRESRLADDVKREIEEIPMWTWSSELARDTTLARAQRKKTNDNIFEAHLDAFRAFFEEMSCLPRTDEVVFGLRVGKWLDNRKQDLKNSRDTEEPSWTILKEMLSSNGLQKSTLQKYPVNIAIPSYCRANTLRKKTVQMLMSHGIEALEVTIFVIESQVDEYSRALDGTPYGGRIVSVGTAPGLAIARNFISHHYDEGIKLTCVDDDVTSVLSVDVDGRLVEVKDLRSTIRDGFIACGHHGAKLWGIYPAQNPFFMTRSKIAVGLKYIVGSFWGVINTTDCEVSMDDKEDFERTLRHYARDGKVVRLEYVTVKTSYYKEPGGMQVNRTRETNFRGAERLSIEFPELCRMKIRHSTGYAELVLRDSIEV